MNRIIKNLAGVFRTWKPAYFIVIALLAVSCKEDPVGQPAIDSIPPSPLKSAEAYGVPGGAIIYYVVPDDDTDISYVKGVYTVDGETRTVRSSVYKYYLRVEGLDSNVKVDIDLYMVDHSENMSEPLTRSFTTSDAPYATIGNTVEISPSIGGIVVRWQNADYTSDIGVVFLAYDDVTQKLKEHAVTFNSNCAEKFFFEDTVPRMYAAYVIDKWGHYSDTTFLVTRPIEEVWLDRTKMRGYPLGNDAPLANANPNDSYYTGAERLFDGIARSLGTNPSQLSASSFGINSPDGTMPIYYTIDLGVVADVNRFWIEPRGHSTYGRYAFGERGGASPYNWDLWGTEVDFGDSTSVNFRPADDPYWTREQWKNDPQWKYMGNYTHRRPSDIFATPENPGARSGTAWDSDLALTYAPPGMENPTNFFITELGLGRIRYIRWQFNQTWSNEAATFFHEAWFWGGIIEEVQNNND